MPNPDLDAIRQRFKPLRKIVEEGTYPYPTRVEVKELLDAHDLLLDRLAAVSCEACPHICLICGKDKPCMAEAECPGTGIPCTFDPTPRQLFDHNKVLRKKLAQAERVVAALKFYADERNWKNNEVDIGVGNLEEPNSSEAYADHGLRAKQALADADAGPVGPTNAGKE